jgi:hypothetical protein
MNKHEAKKLLGRTVKAWTAVNGVYVGRLVGIDTRRGKWRGFVLITGIISPACHFDGTRRHGFRVGELIDVGGISINPAPGMLGKADYMDAVKLERDAMSNYDPSKPKMGWVTGALSRFDAEIERLKKGKPDYATRYL